MQINRWELFWSISSFLKIRPERIFWLFRITVLIHILPPLILTTYHSMGNLILFDRIKRVNDKNHFEENGVIFSSTCFPYIVQTRKAKITKLNNFGSRNGINLKLILVIDIANKWWLMMSSTLWRHHVCNVQTWT